MEGEGWKAKKAGEWPSPIQKLTRTGQDGKTAKGQDKDSAQKKVNYS